jgi:hypothetical protein
VAPAGKAAYFPGLFSVFTSFEFGIPAWMHPSDDPAQDQRIPSIDMVQGLPENQRFMALLNMIASKKIPIAPVPV